MNLNKSEPILTVQQLKARYFFGVDLRDNDGNILSDEVFSSYISQAVDWLEHELQVNIYKKERTHYVDYMIQNYRQYCYVEVDNYPVIDVSLVELHFSDSMKVTFPSQWYKVYKNAGQIQLLPTMSTLSAVIISQVGQILPRAVRSEFAPQLLKIIYNAGFEPDAIPPIINETIGLRATNLILNFLGDIGPAGAGMSSLSQSLDGMSQSLATAISPTNALYGARMLNNDKMLAENLKVLKRQYKRIRLTVG